MNKNNVIKINCDSCGQKYRIDFDKIRGDKIRTKCKACGEIMSVHKPKPSIVTDTGTAGSAVNDALSERDIEEPVGKAYPSQETWPEPPYAKESNISTPITEQVTLGNKKKGFSIKMPRKFGLTGKFMIFTLLPLIIISSLSIALNINKMLQFQGLTIQESSRVVKGISEGLIKQISTTVARQTRQYLFAHPDLRKARFNRDIYFKKVALQNVGITGYTALYEMGDADEGWRYWSHINPELVGQDMKTYQKRVGKHFANFWKIFQGVKNGKQSSGYFKWPDEQGRIRDNFMVCTPVEGTPYVISASIFSDEFTVHLKQIERKGSLVAKEIRNNNALISGSGLLVIGLFIFFYGGNLTKKIKSLSQTADRISMGELEEDIEVRSRDEIGELEKAISRMQTSIRLALKRLREKK